ncbi:SurA N-terminal domain-containing protein [Treponema pedis]|uniref:MOSP complex formation periplasmic protein, TDE1658 family n=1 Tax=Treponema pedis TaxID=409322 RepID=UPI000405E854|nr:SurA N-terminal domain-containing protein [Treponema pedis]
MKKGIVIGILLFCFFGAAFAQSDLQAIAQINLFKKEPVTLGQLKKFVSEAEKLVDKKLTVEERKRALDNLIGQRLLLQAAEKEGLRALDSEVKDYFNNILASQVGYPITESEFAKLVKQKYNQSLDEFFKSNTGSSVAEAKKMLKEQILIQKYVTSKKAEEIQRMSQPTDGDIRRQYELNKQNFFRPDTMKLVIVGVMKKGNDSSERDQIKKLNEKVKKNVKVIADIQKNAEKEGYAVQIRYAVKNAAGAEALGLQPEALMQIFENPVNFVSDITEMQDNRQFFVITEKYDSKLLTLSDVIDPNQPITVYEYIKNVLSSQLQTAALQRAIQGLMESLRTAENTVLIKTGSDLDKILSW